MTLCNENVLQIFERGDRVLDNAIVLRFILCIEVQSAVQKSMSPLQESEQHVIDISFLFLNTALILRSHHTYRRDHRLKLVKKSSCNLVLYMISDLSEMYYVFIALIVVCGLRNYNASTIHHTPMLNANCT